MLDGLPKKVADNIIPEPNSGCWLWEGPNDGCCGYGRVYLNGSKRGVHRYMYEFVNGPIEPGLDVCHRCDTPACCNPDHLFAGTRLENIQDRDRKGRRRRPTGELNPFARVTAKEVMEIRASKDRQVDLAKRYNIHQTTVSLIKTRKHWSHI